MEQASSRDGHAPNAAELKGWNWGAFGLTWIWGLAHRTPIALLTLVPVLGWFGMPVILGLKGNQWAWQNRNWRDLQTFRRHQRSWAKAALVAWVGAIVVGVVGWKIAGSALTSSDAFQLARAELQADPKLSEVLGAPLTFGTPSGSVALGGGGDGTSELKFSVSGPNAQGNAFVVAHKALGAWRVEAAAIELDNGVRMERLSGAPNFTWTGPDSDARVVATDVSAATQQPPRLPQLPQMPLQPSLAEPTGVLSDAAVRRVAARHHSEVRFCMEQDQTPAAGPPSVRVQLVVKPDGSVDSVEVSERSNASKPLENCLVQAVKRWKFKEPTGGAARASLLLKR